MATRQNLVNGNFQKPSLTIYKIINRVYISDLNIENIYLYIL